VQADTLWRIYSMTKPITSVAAMTLVEEGRMELTDPVSRYIPSFADCRVYVQGSARGPGTLPATAPIPLWHLLTHTSRPTPPLLRAGLRLPPGPCGGRHLPPARLRAGRPARDGPGHRLRRLGRDAAGVPARHGVELLGLDRCAGAGHRGGLRAVAGRVLRRA